MSATGSLRPSTSPIRLRPAFCSLARRLLRPPLLDLRCDPPLQLRRLATARGLRGCGRRPPRGRRQLTTGGGRRGRPQGHGRGRGSLRRRGAGALRRCAGDRCRPLPRRRGDRRDPGRPSQLGPDRQPRYDPRDERIGDRRGGGRERGASGGVEAGADVPGRLRGRLRDRISQENHSWLYFKDTPAEVRAADDLTAAAWPRQA